MYRYVILSLLMVCDMSLFALSQKPESQIVQHSVPKYLYKIVSPEQWQKSLLHNQIILSSMDEDFIHLSTEDQIARIAHKYWNNKDYIILKLTSSTLKGRLVYETNPGGIDQYYHLYEGNIPLDAVVDITMVPAQR